MRDELETTIAQTSAGKAARAAELAASVAAGMHCLGTCPEHRRPRVVDGAVVCDCPPNTPFTRTRHLAGNRERQVWHDPR